MKYSKISLLLAFFIASDVNNAIASDVSNDMDVGTPTSVLGKRTQNEDGPAFKCQNTNGRNARPQENQASSSVQENDGALNDGVTALMGLAHSKESQNVAEDPATSKDITWLAEQVKQNEVAFYTMNKLMKLFKESELKICLEKLFYAPYENLAIYQNNAQVLTFLGHAYKAFKSITNISFIRRCATQSHEDIIRFIETTDVLHRYYDEFDLRCPNVREQPFGKMLLKVLRSKQLHTIRADWDDVIRLMGKENLAINSLSKNEKCFVFLALLERSDDRRDELYERFVQNVSVVNILIGRLSVGLSDPINIDMNLIQNAFYYNVNNFDRHATLLYEKYFAWVKSLYIQFKDRGFHSNFGKIFSIHPDTFKKKAEEIMPLFDKEHEELREEQNMV